MSTRIVSRVALFEQLNRAGRITQVSAPAGSGKTTLLRSWIDGSGLAGHAARVSARGKGRDPQRFWIAVVDALRGTAAGSALVRLLTAAPDLDCWVVVEHLLADLSGLRDRTWLIIDDLHELGGTETLRQFQLLMMRAPAELRLLLDLEEAGAFVVAVDRQRSWFRYHRRRLGGARRRADRPGTARGGGALARPRPAHAGTGDQPRRRGDRASPAGRLRTGAR